MARPAHDYARVDKHVPVTRRAETSNPYSPVMILLSLIATLGILFYAQFLLNPATAATCCRTRWSSSPRSILVTHALLSMWTILSGRQEPAGLRLPRGQAAAVRQVGDQRRRA